MLGYSDIALICGGMMSIIETTAIRKSRSLLYIYRNWWRSAKLTAKTKQTIF